MKHACTDARCPFTTTGEPRPARFELITSRTREGEGRWERCQHCGVAVNRSGVPPEEQREFYNEEYLRSHSYVRDQELDAEAHFNCRVDSVKAIADGIVPWLRPEMRVMEIGAAAGELLWHLRPHVAEVFANEIIQAFVDFVQARFGMSASSENYLTLRFERPFDLIISINTIDHIYETRSIVDKIHGDLAPGGLFYLEVPNDNQALRTALPEPGREAFQTFMYQQAHYYSFTPDTVRRLVEECGFTVEKLWSRHDYSLLNYLHWLFAGKPMRAFKQATGGVAIHEGRDALERDLNQLLLEADARFRQVLGEHLRGETLCVLARRRD